MAPPKMSRAKQVESEELLRPIEPRANAEAFAQHARLARLTRAHINPRDFAPISEQKYRTCLKRYIKGHSVEQRRRKTLQDLMDKALGGDTPRETRCAEAMFDGTVLSSDAPDQE